jgi:CDP-diglyceride synthetase
MAVKSTRGGPLGGLRTRLGVWAAPEVRPLLIIWFAMALGAALRLRHFLADRSLWSGEARLANAIIGQPFAAILAPLRDDQAAPLGFLAAVWASAAAFGPSEAALRLTALVASLLALPVFVATARRYLSPRAVPVAVVGFAVAAPLLYYAAEVKPYGVDVLVALCGWLLGAWLLDAGTRRQLALIALCGGALVWLSYPATILLAAIGSVVFYDAVARREVGDALGRAAVVLVWGLSATAAYLLAAGHLAESHNLSDYWFEAFAPMPPSSFSDLRWYIERPVAVFGSRVAGITLPGLGLFLALVGGDAMARNRPLRLSLLVAPFFMAVAASALGRYPFEGRLLLFLAPSALMLIAEGLVSLHRLVRHQAAWLAPAAGVLLLSGMLIEAAALSAAPVREELRPVLEEVYATPGESVYVYYGAVEATRYYVRRLGAPLGSLIYGDDLRGNLPALAAELEELPRGRVWAVYSHVHRDAGVDEEQFSLHVLDKLGRRLKEVRRPGAAAYLYELAGPAR